MKKIIRHSVAFMLLMVLTVNIFASSLEQELEQLEDNKKNAESNINDGKEEVKGLEKTIDSVVARMRDLDIQIDDFEEQINQVKQDTALKGEEIDQALKELDEAKQVEADYFEKTAERIKIMYEYGNTAYMEVLIASKNLSEFFNRVEYVNAMMKYDSNMLRDLENIKNDIVAKEEKLALERESLLALKDEYDMKKKEVEELQANKQNEMDKLETEKETVLARLKALKDEEKKIEAAIKNVKSKMVYDGGKMKWPFKNNYRVTSIFGPRTHPVTNKPSFHTGFDIGASTGTPVKAVYTGTVIFAKYMNAWGNYIIVDHGSGYLSAYAHNSKILVKKGDKVTTGQVIAKAGSTGWSTGPHLHLGIKKNGEWVDPDEILRKK